MEVVNEPTMEEQATGEDGPLEIGPEDSEAKGNYKEASLNRGFCHAFWAVYFPKFVCVQNTRLAVLYYFLIVLLVIGIVVYLVIDSARYQSQKEPWNQIHLCGDGCLPTASQMETQMAPDLAKAFCANPSDFDYWVSSEERYSPMYCARRCGNQSVASPIPDSEACLFPADMKWSTADHLFVPTFIRQTKALPKGASSCPAGMAESEPGICKGDSSYFVPGAGEVEVKFTHEASVVPEVGAWFFNSQNMMVHSRSTEADVFAAGVKTVLFSYDKSVVRTFEPGSEINFTISQLLAAASYEQVAASGELSLDQPFVEPTDEALRVPLNQKPNAARRTTMVRTVGTTLTIELHLTDEGRCRHTFEDEWISVDHTGPVGCMFVHGKRIWTRDTRHMPIGTQGGYAELQAQGIRVTFRPTGAVHLLDVTQLLQRLTEAFVWIQIPLQLVYFFAIWCLGHLSTVYKRVINQELNLSEACLGVASRLVSHSASYLDLQDKPSGISKKRLLERFRKVLAGNSDLDDAEIRQYVNFVFEGMQSLGVLQDEQADSSTINIQEFCTACSTNESLDFESMVKLFDADRPIHCMERLFLDDSIKRVLLASTLDPLARRRKSRQNLVHHNEKRAETFRKLQGMLGTVAELEDLVSVCVRRLDMSPAAKARSSVDDVYSRARVVAMDRRNAGKTVISTIVDYRPTQDPKEDQREEECSIADEAEFGRASA